MITVGRLAHTEIKQYKEYGLRSNIITSLHIQFHAEGRRTKGILAILNKYLKFNTINLSRDINAPDCVSNGGISKKIIPSSVGNPRNILRDFP